MHEEVVQAARENGSWLDFGFLLFSMLRSRASSQGIGGKVVTTSWAPQISW